MAGRSGPFAALRRIVDRARETNVGFAAAGIAYYGLVALLPTVLLAFAALVLVQGEAVAERVVSSVGHALSGEGRRSLRDAILQARGRWQSSALGVAVLLWGSIRLFRGLKVAFARVYRVAPDTSLWREVRDASVALAGVLLAIVAVAGVGTFLEKTLGLSGVFALVAVRFLVIAVLLFPLYYVLPRPDTGVLEVLPGTLTAAAGWMLLRTGFRVYLGVAGGRSVYGVFGALILLVTVLWAASFVVLVGAVVNVVLAGRD